MKIIFEDSQILVCYKEAGLAVQSAGHRIMDLESMLRSRLAAERSMPPDRLHVVHRLDQPVEGLVLFALSSKSASVLGKELTDGRMKKTYLALVSCETAEGRNLIEDTRRDGETLLENYLERDRKTNSSRIVPEKSPESKLARLTFRVRSLDVENRLALLEIDLHTGRHHQIRAQLSGAGLPIAGDRRYGKPDTAVALQPGFPCLCAWKLSFEHPAGGEKMSFEVKPEDCPGQPFWI